MARLGTAARSGRFTVMDHMLTVGVVPASVEHEAEIASSIAPALWTC